MIVGFFLVYFESGYFHCRHFITSSTMTTTASRMRPTPLTVGTRMISNLIPTAVTREKNVWEKDDTVEAST